jgi:hypothetical protein
MKRFGLAAIAAISVLAMPTAASAEDALTYESLVQCAAFNKVVGTVMGSGADADKNKATVDTFNNQSVALMTIAAVGSKKTAEVVFADMNKQSESVMSAMLDKTSGSDYIKTNFEKCKVMGQAAVSIVEDTKNKSK